MDAKSFAMSSSHSLILLSTRLLFYFIENGNKMFYQFDDLIKKHHANPLAQTISVHILPCFAVKFQIHLI